MTTNAKDAKPIETLIREARESAARTNPMLRTYAGAAEVLGVCDGNSIGKWERGECLPSNHNMMGMADAYNAPELKLLYCSRCCPIGKHRVDDPYMGSLERQALQLFLSTQDLDKVVHTAMKVSADGKITANEVSELEEVLEGLKQLGRAVDSFQAGVLKAIKEGG